MLLKLLMHFLGNPVLTPLAISVVTWIVNEYTALLKQLPDALTRVIILTVPPLLAWITTTLGPQLGVHIDLSSINAAAGSLVAVIIYTLGHKKGLRS